MRQKDERNGFIVAICLLLCYIFFSSQVSSAPSAPPVPQRHDTKASPATMAKPKPKIVINTMTTFQTSYTYRSLSNKMMYAKKHNYDIQIDWEGPDYWANMAGIERTIKMDKWDWIWYTDFDTLITNSSIKVENIIADTLRGHPNPDSIDMILTPDCFELNSGSMLLRAHRRTLPFWSLVQGCHPSGSNAQDCIRDLLKENAGGCANRTIMVPQYIMNAFPPEIKCYDPKGGLWEPGMFVIHFAGAWAHLQNTDDATGDLMKKYGHYAEKPKGQ